MAAATLPTNPVRLLLFAVWLCGFTVSAIVWLRWWHRFRADLRSATPLPLDLPVPVMASSNRLEPGVLGIRKPVLLLPEGILTRLTQAQLQSILAHELCHVRRRDNLAAAIHMADEDVLRLGNEPHDYAEGILNVCLPPRVYGIRRLPRIGIERCIPGGCQQLDTFVPGSVL